MTADESPIDLFKPLYKRHKKIKLSDLESQVLDTSQPGSFSNSHFTLECSSFHAQNLSIDETRQLITERFRNFLEEQTPFAPFNPNVITVRELPGLIIIPQFLKPIIQQKLIENIINQYIPDPRHSSNLDPHYSIPRPLYIFPEVQDNKQALTVPIPSKSSKSSINVQEIRDKKLRWITLGGQYDWTAKVYPSFELGSAGFPHFPANLSRLLGQPLFPTTPEAAIINFYSPGDTLSPHQDISEISNADLISISLGCDAIFYVGLSRTAHSLDNSPLAILVKSGDLIVMGGQSRQAFHGVGRVFEDSCPEYLQSCNRPNWQSYGPWMANKRVNINVREMLPRID